MSSFHCLSFERCHELGENDELSSFCKTAVQLGKVTEEIRPYQRTHPWACMAIRLLL